MEVDPLSIRQSPQKDEQSMRQQQQQSFDFLVSKNFIPPPLMLLPKPVSHKPKSLTPMIPLPSFVGIIPNFQPLDKPILVPRVHQDFLFSWIGQAFDNIVYRKYEQQSYKKIDNIDQHWNIWACDLAKLTNKKTQEAQEAANQGEILSYYTPSSLTDRTLVFESRFECGNLSLVSKVADNEYNLLLQNDINTNGYSQWFFFKVSNTRQNQKVKFKILNQYKLNNLYKMGMKIIIYSKRESEQKNVSWHRGGQNIEYYQNGYSKSSINYKPYYTLQWDYEFSYDNDEVYFAYSYPYTFSHLQSFFFKVESDQNLRKICQRSSLCRTLAGNRVDMLTITENNRYQDVDKPYIIITARIHPGESVSSFVCNGILQFLLSNHENAKKLRQTFIFKIIPMLNPDGVIHGNYRSNISGYDLNKKWQNPSKIYQPEMYFLKKLISSIQQIGQVVLFCDLHGHSMKKNAFIYGCHDKLDPKKGKEFPLLMSKIFKGFSFKDCSFLNKDEDQGTSRTVLSKQLNHCNVYALESSFCGPEYQNIHFTIKHFQELGSKFCQAILLYFHQKIKQLLIDAAMKSKSYFTNQDSYYDQTSSTQYLRTFTQADYRGFQERVNSQNSQLSEEEEQSKTILEQRVIKKYLMLRYMRPGTIATKRSNILIRKLNSKQFSRVHLGDYYKTNQYDRTKSNSPIKKKRDVLQAPAKLQKPKIIIKLIQQKKQVHPKLFEPLDMIKIGTDKRRHQSTGKIVYQREKIVRQPERQSNKIFLSKNYQFREDPADSMFKNTFLKSLPKDKQKKMNDFIIRKALPYGEEKNSINLFHSVLSSLKKDRK